MVGVIFKCYCKNTEETFDLGPKTYVNLITNIYNLPGGVGLNLVGANHLFLLDMHWNPQLESQACDRVYR